MRQLHRFVTVLRVVRHPAGDQIDEAASDRHRQNGRASSAPAGRTLLNPSRSIPHAAIGLAAGKASSVPAPNCRGCRLTDSLVTGWLTGCKLTKTPLSPRLSRPRVSCVVLSRQVTGVRPLRRERNLEPQTPNRGQLSELHSLEAAGAQSCLGIDVRRLTPHGEVSPDQRNTNALRGERS